MLNLFRKYRIYADYASAPPVLLQALAAMREAEEYRGNPGALHKEGVAAKQALEDARARIASILGVKSRELVFTSGLTEANNLAIVGYARHMERVHRGLEKTHWIVSAIEHDSVLECFAEIERLGGNVSYAQPNEHGVIQPQEIEKLLKPETVFVSVGWANNEIGVVQPIGKIAQVLRKYEATHTSIIAFHSDAGQAPLYLSTVVSSLGVDFLSLGANKLYGPHGIGALYISTRAQLGSVLVGGAQERGLRAGTESVVLAVGFAQAFEVVAGERETESRRLEVLRNALVKVLTTGIEGLIVNGDLKHALPHMLNISVPNISSEYIVLALDKEGIAISTKSACRESEEASHVVTALGGEQWRAKNTLRISLGRETSESDISRIAETLSKAVASYQAFK
ncbi:cysteine desulfurase [Candidatus Parcubacteria bacterium]|nr:MAG: cysteine desulfurase [Candidatus Parcubacteria bacterium]